MLSSISARWALLLAFGLLLSLNGAGVVTLPALLAAGGLWNLLLAVRAGRGQVWPRQAALELAGDLLLAVALFYFSRTLLGPLALAGLLPVASAALGFGLAGGLAGALVTTAAFAGLAVIDVPVAEIPLRLALPAFAFLVVGSLLSFVGRPRSRKDAGPETQTQPVKREQARSLAAMQAAASLGSSLVFEQVLEAALDLGSTLAGPPAGAAPLMGGVLLFSGGGLRLAASRRLDVQDLGAVLAGKEGVLAAALSDGQPRLSQEPANDPELGQLAGLRAAQSWYGLPLRWDQDLFGVLFFAHAESDYFNEERAELLAAAATQVAGAMQNALRYEGQVEEGERLANLEQHGVAQVARRLHDGPAQSLAAIAMRVNLARRMLPKDPAAAGDELLKLEELSRMATKEMRQLSFSLRPQSLPTGGLALALRDLASQLHEIYNIDVQIEADPEVAGGLRPSQQAALFAIAAEAMTNACQHAQARQVALRLGREATDREVLALDVRDDGTGFPPEEEQRKRETDGALGLTLLRERAALLGGTFSLDSQPGGTRLQVRVPLNEQAAERLWQGGP